MPDIKGALTHKIGPLPVWGWGALTVGGVVAYQLVRGQRAGGVVPASPAIAATPGEGPVGGSELTGIGALMGNLADMLGGAITDIGNAGSGSSGGGGGGTEAPSGAQGGGAVSAPAPAPAITEDPDAGGFTPGYIAPQYQSYAPVQTAQADPADLPVIAHPVTTSGGGPLPTTNPEPAAVVNTSPQAAYVNASPRPAPTPTGVTYQGGYTYQAPAPTRPPKVGGFQESLG